MKIILATYFYPAGIKFTEAFLKTVKAQLTDDFKLVVFNDGVKEAEGHFQTYKGSMEIVNISGTPTQIRIRSFEYLKNTDADHIIFQDLDDEMSPNRIQVLSGYLKEYDIVSNDLSPTDEHGQLLKKCIWSKRLSNGFVFDHTFIRDKNIVGIGNTGIKRSILNTPLKFGNTLPAIADWFLFYNLMYFSNVKAMFTNECETLYRQHGASMAGIKKVDMERMFYVLEVKKTHYNALSEIGFDFKDQISQLSPSFDEIRLAVENNQNTEEELFWLEETKYLGK